MELFPILKKAKLDFSRPTFNDTNIILPTARDTIASLPGNLADDEFSANEESDYLQNSEKETENINVYLRIRPTNNVCNMYKFTTDKVIVSQVDHTKNVNITEKHYSFTSVLNEAVDQVQIYDQIVRPTLSNPFASTGATFASYGVSSSGKTFTILGGSDFTAGLVPRAITQIFTEFQNFIAEFPCVKVTRDEIRELCDDDVESEMKTVDDFIFECAKLNKGKQLSNWSSKSIQENHNFSPKEEFEDRIYIWVSFVEIYNEKITDLLYNASSKSTFKTLKIYSNKGNSYIPGLTWFFVSKIDDALNILKYGLSKVSYASTKINDHSSRSHTIFTINLIAENKSGFQYSSFKFCDLAGAEKSKKAGNVGERLKEAGGINNSLLVLGRCLEAVHHNQSKNNKKTAEIVVPVRDSKLTFLIQSSLLGYEKFFMIVNLFPTSDFFEENLNVLKFASIAKQIVVRQVEVKKFKRPSLRFSYLMQSQLNNSIDINRTCNRINEENETFDESDLDFSYEWNKMSNEQLIEQLRKQKEEIEVIKKLYVQKEQDYIDSEMKLRQDVVKQYKQIHENLSKRNAADKEHLEYYYQQKMDSLKQSYERKLSEAYDEIEDLRRSLYKAIKKNSKQNEEKDINESNEEQEDESCEDDLIEIDD
ncbi:hypothetical protein PVAND_009069 [Polypedilum vanderplanki]|uniref:Kinesin-like protein n=1 Tax=Polypedilum vanderplanki TaxID=319348 RepID=A0A9J6CBS0_POLVA|nr:hypothetical protein PVAND_009069 [Polypedilum vanderplanki]